MDIPVPEQRSKIYNPVQESFAEKEILLADTSEGINVLRRPLGLLGTEISKLKAVSIQDSYQNLHRERYAMNPS